MVPIILRIFAASNQLNSKIMGIIISLLLGCLAGFCAGKLMKGGGFGIIGWLFDLLGISWGGLLGQLATAIIGAALILWIASFFKK